MKLVLNFGAASWLGGRYYLENLAAALRALDESKRPELFALGENVLDAVRVDVVPPDADVVFPNWGLPRKPAANVVQIHWIPDLQHRRLPQNFGRLDRVRRDLGYRRLIRRAQVVVVSSEVVAEDVRRAYPQAAAKLQVVHFRTAVPPDALDHDPHATLARLGLPARFILLPNQFWAHKNHATALAALGELPLPLVCTGEARDTRRPGFAERLVADAQEAMLSGRLFLLGVVTRDDYLQLVRSAAAVLQPSLFEGWSSIVEDARAFGRPIALSDIDVHREQGPPHARFFRARDPRDLAAAVSGVLQEPVPAEAEALEAQCQRVLEYGARFMQVVRDARAAL